LAAALIVKSRYVERDSTPWTPSCIAWHSDHLVFWQRTTPDQSIINDVTLTERTHIADKRQITQCIQDNHVITTIFTRQKLCSVYKTQTSAKAKHSHGNNAAKIIAS